MKKLLKKLKRTQKALQSWKQRKTKANDILSCALHKIWFAMFIFLCCTYCGCGTTKMTATITQPKDGSANTITITTNTPITTDVKPNTNVKIKTL